MTEFSAESANGKSRNTNGRAQRGSQILHIARLCGTVDASRRHGRLRVSGLTSRCDIGGGMGSPGIQFDAGSDASKTALVRVLVADNAPTRLGIRMALDGFAIVCAEAGDREGAVRAAASSQPDVCLIGRSLVGGGIETVREIGQAVSRTSVVVLADSQEADDLLLALRAGAIGYLPVDFEPGQLRRVIAAVRSEQAAIPRTMVMELVDEIRSFERATSGPLTLREMQVLTMLRRGDSTASIAQGLSISPVTVRRHISELVHKAGVHGREELSGAFTKAGARVNI